MISVIVPCFNYGHLIAQTIESVLNQTYSEIEIIVIDDGSTDNTQEILNRFTALDKRISYYKYENGGPSMARNIGLQKCKGKYVQFLDADDLLEKKKFELQIQIFDSDPGIDVVYGSVRYFHTDTPSERLLTYWGANKEWMPKLTGKRADILSAALKGNFAHLSSVLFKKELIDKAGFFDDSLRIAEDYHFLIRCVLADAYFYYDDTPQTYSLVRWHSNNVSQNVKMMRTEEIGMRRKIIPLLANYPEALYNNNNAIQSLSLQLSSSWKKHFLSGGKFDFIKNGARLIGLEKILLKVFYK